MKEAYSKLQPVARAAKPIAAGVEVGHVHMKTANIAKIREFYVDILGFDVVAEMPTALFLSAGGYHHDLAFNTWESLDGPSPMPYMTGLYHIALRYPTRADLGDALRRLTAVSWPLEGVNDHGTHEAIYLRDPDNNGLELCWDRPEDEWPLDAEGHLALHGGGSLDIEGLMKAGL